jgi:hypothetical protein
VSDLNILVPHAKPRPCVIPNWPLPDTGRGLELDPRLLKAWLIKRLMPAVGHGLLSGQWGAGKTFVAFDLAAALSEPAKKACFPMSFSIPQWSSERMLPTQLRWW